MDPNAALTDHHPTVFRFVNATVSEFSYEAQSIAKDEGCDNEEHAIAISQTVVSKSSARSNFSERTPEQQILALLRQSILPFSDRLDPFAALPVQLDRLQEHLVSFYLLQYPQVTYGFSPHLRPHPVATNFSIALTTPACFQVILARSALYRLSLNQYANDKEKKSLEVAMARHKGEALRLIRALSAKSSPTRKDDLIASIISVGTLDRRTGSTDAAGTHFMAVRRILKATGGPLAVKSLMLSRVMVFFECIYGTSPESYIWDAADLKGLLPELNAFFGRIWILWEGNSTTAQDKASEGSYFPRIVDSTLSRSYLQADSALRSILTRPAGPMEPSEEHPLLPKHRFELMSQLTCLLTLATIVLDYSKSQESARSSTFGINCPPEGPSSRTAPSREYDDGQGESGSYPLQPQLPHLAPKLARSSIASQPTMAEKTKTTDSSAPVMPSNPTSSTVDVERSSRPTTHSTSLPTPVSIARGSSTSCTSTSASPLSDYLATLHDSIDALELLKQPSNNVMWQIQINDHSEAHSRRIWRAASYAWVLKHVNWKVQNDVKRWLCGFLTGRSIVDENGRRVERRLKLEACHFSYAA